MDKKDLVSIENTAQPLKKKNEVLPLTTRHMDLEDIM